MMRDDLLTCAVEVLTPTDIGELQRRARILAYDYPLQRVRMQCLELAANTTAAIDSDVRVRAAQRYYEFVTKGPSDAA